MQGNKSILMLKQFAWGISVIFHPLLGPTYMLILLLLINPYLFGVHSIGEQAGKYLLLLIFLYTFFVPALSILVMYFLGMVSSLDMPDKQERIGPYLITGIFYGWVFYNFLKNGQVPTAYTSFMLGTVIALFMAFFVNIFSKISAHAVGMGGLVGMVLISMLFFSYGTFRVTLPWMGVLEISVSMLLLAVVLLAGLVGSSRLILKAHEQMDLYGGYIVGFFAQVVAFRFLF